MATYHSTRCARTEHTGAGATTSLRSYHIQRSPCRWAEPWGRRRVGLSFVLLPRCLAGVKRQPDPEPGIPGNGLHLEVAVVPADDDPPGDVQSQARTLAYGLGGEERLEDPVLDLLGDARAGGGELHEKPLAIRGRPDGQRSISGHGRDRVVDQVGPDLIELGRVRRYARQGAVILLDHPNARPDLGHEHGQGAVEQVMDVDHLVWSPVQLRVVPGRANESGDHGDGGGDFGHQEFGLNRVTQAPEGSFQPACRHRLAWAARAS